MNLNVYPGPIDSDGAWMLTKNTEVGLTSLLMVVLATNLSVRRICPDFTRAGSRHPYSDERGCSAEHICRPSPRDSSTPPWCH